MKHTRRSTAGRAAYDFQRRRAKVVVQNSAFCDIDKEEFVLVMKIINSISWYLKELLSK